MTPLAADSQPPVQIASPAGIRTRAAELSERVAAAAQRSGRDPSAIGILAVTKTHPPALVRSAYDAGLREFGENYVQEALAKQDELNPSLLDVRWHLIGHLQSNKTNAVAGRFALIHSVDSLKLGERLARAPSAGGIVQDVLVQVKLGDEETKAGVLPSEVLSLCDQLAGVDGLRVRGLMAIAPLGPDGYLIKQPRPYFAQAKRLFDALPAEQRQVLSMGMSGDYETAIEEGATLIRVGTTLFGNRAGR